MFRFTSVAMSANFSADTAGAQSHSTDSQYLQSTSLSVPLIWGRQNSELITSEQDYLVPNRQPVQLAAAGDAPPQYAEVHPNVVRLSRMKIAASRVMFSQPTAIVDAATRNTPAVSPHDTQVFSAAVRDNGRINSWAGETAKTGFVNGVSGAVLGLGIGKIVAVATLGPVLGGLVVLGGGSAVAQANQIWGAQSDQNFFEDLSQILRVAIERDLEHAVGLPKLKRLRSDATSPNKKRMFNDFSLVLTQLTPTMTPDFRAALALL